MRNRLSEALKTAMKEKDTKRLSTLRLINAAIKDREIAMRGEGEDPSDLTDDVILGILGKMVKQRQESARAYEEGGRLELAEACFAFLPIRATLDLSGWAETDIFAHS